jgi:hypothetical protein
MAYPALTTDGETVMVADKCIEDGSANIESVLLTSEDGRKFRPTPNGLRIQEISEGLVELDTSALGEDD